jgi:hypothetical protein
LGVVIRAQCAILKTVQGGRPKGNNK